MKKILVLGLGLVMGLGLFSSQAAEEATEKADVTTYKVAMKGVTWKGCQKDVRAAFKKLDGIVCEDLKKDIQIKNGEVKGTQVVTFKSSKPITKEQAIAAIGKKANKYVVTGVEKSDG